MGEHDGRPDLVEQCGACGLVAQLRLLVGDDGLEPSPCTGVDYLRLPQDIGVSAGRAALLNEVKTPYYMLLDDDVEFFRPTTIEDLIVLVDQGSFMKKVKVVSSGEDATSSVPLQAAASAIAVAYMPRPKIEWPSTLLRRATLG